MRTENIAVNLSVDAWKQRVGLWWEKMKPIPIRKDEAYNRASVQGVLVTLFRNSSISHKCYNGLH